MKNKENQAGAAEEIEEGCQRASAGRPQEQGEPSSAAEQPAQGSQASGACSEEQGEQIELIYNRIKRLRQLRQHKRLMIKL